MAKSTEDEFTQPKIIQLRRIEDMILEADIVGVTPVIPHRWSEKSLRMMRDKQMSATSAPRARKEPKNPEEEAHDSCYWLEVKGEDGTISTKGAVPATAFKAAMVGACRFYEGITMTQAKLLFYVEGEGPDQLVPDQRRAGHARGHPAQLGRHGRPALPDAVLAVVGAAADPLPAVDDRPGFGLRAARRGREGRRRGLAPVLAEVGDRHLRAVPAGDGMTRTTVKLSELIEDFDIYPRHSVDSA